MAYYEFNVAKLNRKTKRHEHLFATHERSCRDEAKARELADEICSRFQMPEFDVTITKREEKIVTVFASDLSA